MQAKSRASPEVCSYQWPDVGDTKGGRSLTCLNAIVFFGGGLSKNFQTPFSGSLSRSKDPLGAVREYDVDKEDGEHKNG